jgi:hypothetical protein
MGYVVTKLGLFTTNFALTGHGIPHYRARLAKEQLVYQLHNKNQLKIEPVAKSSRRLRMAGSRRKAGF